MAILCYENMKKKGSLFRAQENVQILPSGKNVTGVERGKKCNHGAKRGKKYNRGAKRGKNVTGAKRGKTRLV